MQRGFPVFVPTDIATDGMKLGATVKKIILTLFLFLPNIIYAQEINVTFKDIKESNKEKNYTIDVSYPQVDFGYNTSAAENINKALDSIIAGQIKDFKNSVEENKGIKLKGAVNELDIKSSVTNSSHSLLSVLISNFTYIVGSAHPLGTDRSFNYSADKGVLNLSNLFIPNSGYIKFISDYSIKKLKEWGDKYGLKNNEWIEEGASPDAKNFEVYNIKEDSLIITFNTYQVAPYFAGGQTVAIPLSEMKDMLDPKGSLSYIIK